MFNLNKKLFKYFDWALFITMIITIFYGVSIIFIATVSSKFGYMRYLKPQLSAFIIGLIVIAIILIMDYEIIGKLYIPIYLFSCIPLVAVLFTSPINGARSWLKLGPVGFQPSEIAKITLIICVAKFIDLNKERINEPLILLKVLAFSFMPVALILKQPDFGTAMVCTFFIAVMLFIAGLNWKYIISAIVLGLGSLPILWFRLDPYQKNRILVFLDPTLDPVGSGYQVLQAKTAIGSGELLGRGIENAKFIKYGFLPENHTDMIFAVIGEVFGFVGGLVLVFLYFIMFTRLISLAKNSKNSFGSLMIMGIASMLLIHVIENIGMTIGLMPVTGIPLPFISYGGTSLLANMIGIGIALSVGMRKKNLNF